MTSYCRIVSLKISSDILSQLLNHLLFREPRNNYIHIHIYPKEYFFNGKKRNLDGNDSE